MSYQIITDTSANLPSSYLMEHGVDIAPFSYFVEGVEMQCLNSTVFDGKKFYDDMRAGMKVTTSQINPQTFEYCFEKYLSQGQDILFISMSSGISGSYNSSMTAAEALKEKYPERKIVSIDTRAASLGEGLFVMLAVENRDQGMSIADNEEFLRSRVQHIYQVFTVDDLKYLSHTGRLHSAVAFVTSMLNIKPLLKGDEMGRIVNFGIVRGRKKAVQSLAQKYDELVVNPGEQTVCIAHADCEAEAAQLAEMLRRNHPPKEIMTVDYEPVTGSHVGPGTIALFFFGGENVRAK
ncbi:MAG: DegV family protein [Clostridia bacterium]|nr:DegV family protein [Clostridia bacterium]